MLIILLGRIGVSYLRVLLDDEDTWDLFVPVAEALARADVPEKSQPLWRWAGSPL